MHQTLIKGFKVGELGWLDILKGAGSILQAGATVYTGREQSKAEKAKLDYQKEQDKMDQDKLSQAQTNLDSAISEVYGADGEKKKKKTSTTDLSLSYGTPSTEI